MCWYGEGMYCDWYIEVDGKVCGVYAAYCAGETGVVNGNEWNCPAAEAGEIGGDGLT